MAVAGALIGGAIGAFGTKPKIPKLPEIDPSKVQTQTVEGNIAAMPKLQELGARVNQFNQQQLAKALEFSLPGGLAAAQGIISSQLRGEIPADVAVQVANKAAAQGFQSGFGPGSGIGKSLTARDFGLTSMQIQQQGLGNFQALAGFTSAPQFDVTSMFFTPQQRLQFAFQDRAARFERNLLKAQVKAAPDPARAALGKEIDRFFNTWAGFGMTALGAGMGGGGGAGAGAGQNVPVQTAQLNGSMNLPQSQSNYSFGLQ